MGAAASREAPGVDDHEQVTRRMSKLYIQDKVDVEGDDARTSKSALL